MSRRVVAILAALSTLVLAGAPLGFAQDSASLALRVAKTQRRVTLFGSIEPRRAGEVRVRLFRDVDGAWKRLGTQRVELTRGKDSDGDGTKESSFSARFPRPKTGQCRAVAVLLGDGARDVDQFPCYIPNFPAGTATITSGVVEEVEIRALIAETDEHRQYGFMYRPRIPEDLGMAFLWEEDTSGGFWMKNTLVPLSIAFFDESGVILRIMDMEPCHADDTESDCESHDPGVSYQGALEVNLGAFEVWGVQEGDHIEITQ